MPTGRMTSKGRTEAPKTFSSPFKFSMRKPEYLKTTSMAKFMRKLMATTALLWRSVWDIKIPDSHVTTVDVAMSSAYSAFQHI